jgi:hypothetical protein
LQCNTVRNYSQYTVKRMQKLHKPRTLYEVKATRGNGNAVTYKTEIELNKPKCSSSYWKRVKTMEIHNYQGHSESKDTLA